jgi:hypoxanthine phosphoribosyltransferase/molybdopterin converting factor small subunit
LRVRIRLLASLREAAGKDYIEVEAASWREALTKALKEEQALKQAVTEDGNPKPGYLVFVDGIDARLLEGREKASEIVVLPVNHGGSSESLFYVTWSDIEESVNDVASKVRSSGFEPDVVVGVLRGGVIPARLLADELGVDELGVIEIKLYTGIGSRKPRPYIRQPLILDVYNKNVLIVDDVSDTGLTLSMAVEAIRLYMPAKLKTATLYVKPWTRLFPDYYSKVVDKWIVFPWERREVERELASQASGARE